MQQSLYRTRRGPYREQMDGFGARLRRARERHGLSQSELARRIGRSPSYINLVESGKRLADQYPPWDVVRAMAAALGMTDEALAGSTHADGAARIASPRAAYTVKSPETSADDAALGRAIRALVAASDVPASALRSIPWLDDAGQEPPLALPAWLLPAGADPAALRSPDDGLRARGVGRGDIAIVDRARPTAIDDRLLAVRADGGPVLGVCQLSGKMPRLVRPGHPDLSLGTYTATIIGPVVGLIALGPR